MTVDEVLARVAQVQRLADAGDDEDAHAEEDSLRCDVLDAIANGTAVDDAVVARAALMTAAIKFERWYA